MLSTKVTGTEVTSSGVKLTVQPSKGGDSTTVEADVVLVSTGRRPFTKNIGLETLGIETDKLGRIKVDGHFKTSVPSIFAIGKFFMNLVNLYVLYYFILRLLRYNYQLSNAIILYFNITSVFYKICIISVNIYLMNLEINVIMS